MEMSHKAEDDNRGKSDKRDKTKHGRISSSRGYWRHLHLQRMWTNHSTTSSSKMLPYCPSRYSQPKLLQVVPPVRNRVNSHSLAHQWTRSLAPMKSTRCDKGATRGDAHRIQEEGHNESRETHESDRTHAAVIPPCMPTGCTHVDDSVHAERRGGKRGGRQTKRKELPVAWRCSVLPSKLKLLNSRAPILRT